MMSKVVPVLLLGLLSSSVLAEPGTNSLPCGTNGTSILPDAWQPFEASGVSWHPALDILFVVDDEGAIGWLNRDGTPIDWCPRLRTAALLGLDLNLDLEAITVADPNSPYIYVLVEAGLFASSVLEVDYEKCWINRIFALSSYPNGSPCNGCPLLTTTLETLVLQRRIGSSEAVC